MDADWRGVTPSLPELVSPERWQRLQDHFADVLGIGLRTFSPDRRLLVNPSWPSGLDAQKLTTLLNLGEELEELMPQDALPQETTTILRPMGISFSACPIRATVDCATGYLVVGPVVLGRRESAEQLRNPAAEAGLDLNVLWPLMLTIKLYSFGSMRSVLRLLEEVGNTLLELSYQAKTLKTILPDVPRVDHAVAEYYTDRLSQSLLEVATAATNADGGSVMLMNPQQGTLEITAAQGLSREIIAGTKQRPDEGIAGRAMAEQQILLVDERAPDERLRGLMKRPELTSSLVAPLVSDLGRAPVGVLNLRTSHPQRRFTPDQIELLRRLLTLAGVALGSLQLAFGPRSSPSS